MPRQGTRCEALAPLTLAVCTSCQAFVGDYDTKPAMEPLGDSGMDFTPIDGARLCEIEREHFTFELDLQSDSALDSLEAYYERANPELVAHLAGLAAELNDGADHAGVTYLIGAAGVGKSFLTRNALGAFSATQLCEVNLTDLFGEDKALLEFEISTQPDLTTLDGSLVFNELPSIANLEAFAIDGLLRAGDCYDEDGDLRPMIVVDGIDEIQDESAVRILKDIDDLAMSADDEPAFLHFLVAGRSGGFAGWFSDARRNERNNALLERFDLEPPRYQTRGDLQFRALGYLDFTKQLEGLESDGDLDAYLDTFYEAVEQSPYLTYSLGNLYLGNAVVENTGSTWDDTSEGDERPLLERNLKARLTDDILFRNAGTHGRPGAGGPLDEAYMRLLEEIAVANVGVSADGDFRVDPQQSVDVVDDDGDVVGSVRVRDVLNRGGVAISTSPGANAARFRFEPFWLHAHLIELFNQRQSKTHQYRGCD